MLMPDVNILIYAHRADSEHHKRHARWVTETAKSDRPFALSELVVSGFIRVVTNKKAFGRPSTLDQAFSFVRQLTVRPTCRLIRPGPRHLAIFERLCRETHAVGGFVADAYHAALAIEHGCTWITNDTDFARFSDLEWRTA